MKQFQQQYYKIQQPNQQPKINMLDQDQLKRDSSTNRPSHKKIFPAPSKPYKEEKSSGNLPHCYFHKQQKIIKFCECKQCTLPLCHLCEEIHVSQHQKQSTKPQIKSYNDVKASAYRLLQRVLDTQRQSKESLQSRLKVEKQKILKLVNEHFDKMQQSLDNHTLSQEQIKVLQTREEKIRKGSIKALIQNYSDEYSKLKQLRLYVNFTSVNFSNILNNAISLTSDDIAYQNNYQKYTRGNQILGNRTDFVDRKKTPTHGNKDILYSGKQTTFASPHQKLGANTLKNHQIQDQNDQQNRYQQNLNRTKRYQDYKIKFEPFRDEKINSQLQAYSYNRVPGQQLDYQKSTEENAFQQPLFAHRKNLQQYTKNNPLFRYQNYENSNNKKQIVQNNNYFFPINRPLTTQSNNKSLVQRPFFNTTLNKEKVQQRKGPQFNPQKKPDEYYHEDNEKSAISPKPISQEEIKIAITKPQQLAERLKNRSLETINRAINSSYTKIQQRNVMPKQEQFASKKTPNKELMIGLGQETKRSEYPSEHEPRLSLPYQAILTARQNYHRQRSQSYSQLKSDRNLKNKSSELIANTNINTKYEPQNTLLDNFKKNQQNQKIQPNATIEQPKFFNYKARTHQTDNQNNNNNIIPNSLLQNTEKQTDFKSKYEEYKQRKQEYKNYDPNFTKPLPSSSGSSSVLSKTYKYITSDFPDDSNNNNKPPVA